MSEAGPMLTNDDFASLTFGDKLSLSKALCRGYGLTVWALIMAGGLALGFFALSSFSMLNFSPNTLVGLSNGSLAADSIDGPLMGLLLLIVTSGLVMQFLLIGVNTLILLYIKNQAPTSAVQVFLSPWSRFGPIFLCLMLWLGISLLVQMVAAALGRLPWLGFLMELSLSLGYSIASNCAMFYIADKILCRDEDLSPPEAVLRPLAIVSNNPLTWLATFAFILIIYLPFALMGLMGLMDGALIMALIGGLGLTAASVYAFFLLGLTYRQTLAQYERMSPQAN